MWATYPMLPQAIMTLEAWGFTYKTVAFTWVKTTRKYGILRWYGDLLRGIPRYLGLHTGMGYWTRSNAEVCLLGTTGHPKRVSKSVHSVIISPVREHSRKPDEARDRIVHLLGDIPRIELFAREHTPGWQVWGDEVE